MSQLAQFMSRYENLHDDKKNIDSDISELLKEVEGAGYEKKAFKEAFKRITQGEQFDLFDTKVNLYIDDIRRASSRARDAREAPETPPEHFTIDITATAQEVEPAAPLLISGSVEDVEPEPEQTAEVLAFPTAVDDGTVPVIYRGETIRISAERFAELKAAGSLKVHSIGNVEALVDPREDVAA